MAAEPSAAEEGAAAPAAEPSAAEPAAEPSAAAPAAEPEPEPEPAAAPAGLELSPAEEMTKPGGAEAEIETPDPGGKSTRRRRLSIISLPNEKKEGRGAGEKDTEGQTIQAGGAPGDRRRRKSVVGLYTGEINPSEDNGAGADPDAPEHVNVVKTIGYTSKAGYETTGHKKTNQDAFVVLQVRVSPAQLLQHRPARCPRLVGVPPHGMWQRAASA
jgi:hypothetical protein